jgi:hypothetical protein
LAIRWERTSYKELLTVEAGKMNIYVLVEVTYDYYRFQFNLEASHNREDLKEVAKRIILDKKRAWPVLDYKQSSETQFGLDKDEVCHYWIQEFE